MAASASSAKLSFLPEKLRDRLMPFQRDGVLFGIAKNGRCLVADEMGLGKTVQALSIAYYYKDDWPLLIIVPASLRYPWIEEIEKWLPGIHPHEINLIQGGADVEDIPVAKITVVTYGLLRHPMSKVVQEALRNQQFKVIIADESHYMKNRKSATTKYIVPLLQRSPHKILLTGTPTLARPEELYPQVDSIVPGKFGSWTSYANKFCDARTVFIGRIRKWVTDGASNLEELQAMLREKVMIRRLKKDVLTQLPPKQRQRIPFDLKESDVKKSLEKVWSDLNEAMGKKNKSVNSLLSGDTEVAGENQAVEPDPLQVCDPAVAPTNTVFGLLSELHSKTCLAKIGPVKDYLKMLCQNEGLKFIMFAHHHIMMDSLAEQLMDDDVKFIRIDGNTAMQDRPRLVHEYQADNQIRCALLSMKAAGVGLTLTAAKLVVFAELDWTPGTHEQCEDRAHRIGQKDTVHVHYLVAKGTLDERVWAALCRKTTVVSTTLNGKTQVLKMDEGNVGQKECLSNADVFVPQKKDVANLTAFLQTPQPRDQRSIVDFFTPRGAKKGKSSPTKNKQTKNKTIKRDIVVIDEDEDEGEFLSPNTENREKRKRKERAEDLQISDSEESKQSSQTSAIPQDSEDVDHMECDIDDLPVPRTKRRRLRDILADKVTNDDESEKSSQSDKEMHTPVKDTKTGKPGEWSCEMCTYLNSDLLPYCEMCSTPKRKGKKSPARKPPSPQSTDNSRPNHDGTKPSTSQTGAYTTVQSANTPDKEDVTDKIESSNCDNTNGANRQTDNIPQGGPVTVVPESDMDSMSGSELLQPDEKKGSDKITEFSEELFSSATTNEKCESTKIGEFSEELFSNSESLGSQGNVESAVATPKRSTHLSASENCVTPTNHGDDLDDTISKETAAAKQLFSPGFKKASRVSRRPWPCTDCGVINDIGSEDCDGCLASRPDDISMEEASAEDQPQTRVVNLDNVPIYSLLKFCCSKNTSRVYLYDSNNKSLNVNFTPLDIEMDNLAELPDLLLQPDNLKLVRRFVREWNSLSPTKRRLVIKSGKVFISPTLLYEELKSGQTKTTQRYNTKVDNAKAAMNKAEQIGGSVRVIQRPKIPVKKSRFKQKKGIQFDNDDDEPSSSHDDKVVPGPSTVNHRPEKGRERRGQQDKGEEKGRKQDKENGDRLSSEDIHEHMKGIVQALSEDGTPLCVSCQRPYYSELVNKKVVEKNPWQTRFCSKLCMDQHWMKSHREYAVDQVFHEEHGICQMCSFDCQQFFNRIKGTTDLYKRAKLIQESKYGNLKTEIKQKMARNPKKGMFWQVDHITPVVEGGGMCDIDNLRTLCVLCHRDETSKLLRGRAKQKQMREAAKCGDITAFFSSK